MGILDPPAINPARVSAAGYMAIARDKLDRDLENVNIGVIGDSTGKGTGTGGTDARWPYLYAQKLATAYPTKTVNFHDWDVTGNAYLANVVVQTGSGTGNAGGPFTIDIWNGSAVGMTPSYSQTWMFSMLPATVPDLVFINHGHNIGTADIAAQQSLYQLGRDIVRWFNANVPLVFMTQNPQTSPRTAAQINNQYKLMTRLMENCANEGWGLLNTMQVFLDYPSWATAGLVEAAGVHPAAPAGNALWVNALWAVWQQSAYATPVGAISKTDRIWLPATALTPSVLIAATPAAAVINSFLQVMGYGKQAGDVSASTSVFIPPAWRSANLWVYWTTSDGVAGNVRWKWQQSLSQRINQETQSAANAVALSLGGSALATGAAPGAAFAESHTLVSASARFGLAGTAPNVSRLVFLQLTRAGADAADTYAGTAQMLGVMLERSA